MLFYGHPYTIDPIFASTELLEALLVLFAENEISVPERAMHLLDPSVLQVFMQFSPTEIQRAIDEAHQEDPFNPSLLEATTDPDPNPI